MGPIVGIIANPISARDIRRVVADASSLQTADRAGIVLRVMKALAATGVGTVLLMPDRLGIRAHVERRIRQAQAQDEASGRGGYPNLEVLEMPVSGTVADTLTATRLMRERGVRALVVLGGDGTHRAVAAECGPVPIAGISTGTNNAFPHFREATVLGLAVGLAASGRVPESVATRTNKALRVDGDGWSEIALVDVAVVTDRFAGARALWRTESFRELYCAFAEPGSVGMSAIAALVDPVSRTEPAGIGLALEPAADAPRRVLAPIAPGIVEPIGLRDAFRLAPGRPVRIALEAGSIAFDGERERLFGPGDDVRVTLVTEMFRTVDVEAALQFAARHGLMVQDGTAPRAA
ncbi:ATP-NAD kinase family protein [Methylobacterium sp. sgz302541]|uniref:ATP-NAD kinase family protein n=1 Tax=unclassified Methylobacterium TaxID=2615210 RepID=UPI003D33C867